MVQDNEEGFKEDKGQKSKFDKSEDENMEQMYEVL